MNRYLNGFATVVALFISSVTLTCAANKPCKENCMQPAPIVFFDIAGPDASKLRSFYSDIFGWKIGANYSINKSDAGVNGTLRQDPANKIIYLGVTDINATLKEITAAGGSIIAPRFEVPGVVILALFTDPAGNGMGLVEMEAGQPKIPPLKKKT